MKYQKHDIDNAIQEAITSVSNTPTFSEYLSLNIDPHPSQSVIERFYNGWNHALLANGEIPNRWTGVPLEEVKDRWEERGPLKHSEVQDEENLPSPGWFKRNLSCDNWDAVLEELGHNPDVVYNRSTKDAYLAELRNANQKFDKLDNPKWSEYLVEETDLGRDGWYKYWDSWHDFLSEIGEEATSRYGVTKDDLRKMWEETAEDVGRCPKAQEIKDKHNISSSLIQKYGGWEGLCEEFGYDTSEAKSGYTPTDCVKTYNRIKGQTGEHPTKFQYEKWRRKDEPGKWIIPNFWGSWSEFKKSQGFTPDVCEDVTPESCMESVHLYLDQAEDPTSQDYTEWRRDADKPHPSIPQINRVTDGWNALLQELGQRPNRKDEYSYEAYEDAFRVIEEGAEHSPPRAKDAYQFQTRPSPIKMIREFGSWNEVLLEFYGDIRWDPETVNGDYDDGGHYYGPEWYQIRPKIRKLDRHQCQRCGMDSEEHQDKYNTKLHVHHIRPFRLFDDHKKANRRKNLVTLCYKCHRQLEIYATEEDIKSQIGELEGDRWE